MIAITGASGQLGRLVIKHLIAQQVPAQEIIAVVRDPQKVDDLKKLGIQIKQGDYNKPETLKTALAGANRILLISSNEIGKRLEQHQAVVDAAKILKPELIAYTSILKADTSTLSLAQEHLATENYIAQSGLNYSFLRNGWYIENYTMSLPSILEHQTVFGAAEDGKIAAATRNDFALAAAKILTSSNPKKIYELAGDQAFTLSDFAKAVSEVYNKDVKYQNLPEEDFKKLLIQVGLPEAFASMLAETESKIPSGQLYSESKDLHQLIGRDTENLFNVLKA